MTVMWNRSKLARAFPGIVILGGALLAYSNSFHAPFVFDDLPSIVENASIRSLWPLTGPLSPPSGFGFTVSGRPILNLSLAVNYAISGIEPWSYHVTNLVIHATAGLVLFGILRRTFERENFSAQLREKANVAALMAALIWTLHPLQTEAVTYVIQRAESLMGLFFLLMIYCFCRALAGTVHQREWKIAAVVACGLGMASKEVMAVAPVVVGLYDRQFSAEGRAQGLKGLWRARRLFYLGLVATWVLLGWLVWRTGGDRGGTFVLNAAAFGDYWLLQAEAVWRYLRLTIWPSPLIFEYGTKVTTSAAIQGLAFIALLGSLVVGVVATGRRSVTGFCLILFSLMLAPASLVPGVTQVIVEHRMYLALAPLLAWLVGAAFQRWNRAAPLLACAVALIFGGLTWRRNQDYRSDLALWEDTVTKRPTSARAQSSLGSALFARGKLTEAEVHFAESHRLDPNSGQTCFNLALVRERLGDEDDAIVYYQEALRILPYFAQADVRLGMILLKRAKATEAAAHFQHASELLIEPSEADYGLGLALTELDRPKEAILAFERALKSRSSFAEAELGLAMAWLKISEFAKAKMHAERARQLQSNSAEASYDLGLIAAAAGDAGAAKARYREAIQIDATHGEARLNLGILLAQAGEFSAAEAELREAVRLRPNLAEAPANLGIVLAEEGKIAEAIGNYEAALRLRPDYAMAHYNLANALLRQERWAVATKHLVEAVRLQPDFPEARELLQRLESFARKPNK